MVLRAPAIACSARTARRPSPATAISRLETLSSAPAFCCAKASSSAKTRSPVDFAASSNAYVLADRGTWLAFKNRADLAILVEGDKRLFNQYGVIVVNPARHPHVKKDLAQAFADWVVSPAGQTAIASYKIGGEQLFFPNAGQ